MTDIVAQDCRIEGFVSGAIGAMVQRHASADRHQGKFPERLRHQAGGDGATAKIRERARART
jgi:hypothetical protein